MSEAIAKTIPEENRIVDVRMQLRPAKGLPRTMNITLDTGGGLSVTLFEQSYSRTIGFAVASLDRCAVYWYHPIDAATGEHTDDFLPTLVIGDAMFDIAEYDAERIVRCFGVREQRAQD